MHERKDANFARSGIIRCYLGFPRGVKYERSYLSGGNHRNERRALPLRQGERRRPPAAQPASDWLSQTEGSPPKTATEVPVVTTSPRTAARSENGGSGF